MASLKKLGNKLFAALFQGKRCSFFQSKRLYVLKLFPVGLCVANQENIKKIEFPSPKTLTHDFLIKQASTAAVNGATQLLTQTVAAILDTSEQYQKALSDLLSLLKESKEMLNNEPIQQELSDLIIASRAKANDFKNLLMQLESLLTYVEKVVLSTAEASYLAGAEFVSISMSERMDSAKLKVDEVMRVIKMLENELMIMQKDVIIESSKH